MKNDTETNIFYTLAGLEKNDLTKLKYRMLTYRLKELLTAGKIKTGKKLYKESNRWFIHYSLVDLFQSKRNNLNNSLKTEKYITEVTVNLPANYDLNFYDYLGNQLTEQLAPAKSIFSVEKSPTDIKYHLHLITTAYQKNIIEKLKQIETSIDIEIINNINTNIAPIENRTQTVNYISKESQTLIDKLK